MLVWCDYYIKDSDKENLSYGGYGITFDRNGEWIFGNDYAKNVVIFVVDNRSSPNADNCKNNF